MLRGYINCLHRTNSEILVFQLLHAPKPFPSPGQSDAYSAQSILERAGQSRA